MNNLGPLKTLAAAVIAFVIAILIVRYAHGCSTEGPTKVVNNPIPTPVPVPDPTVPPANCDGASLGDTKDGSACPDGEIGKILLACTSTGWKEVSNTCATPTCTKTTFADVKPILTRNCVGSCHVAPRIDELATAKAWSAQIARRIVLPTSDNDHMPKGTSTPLVNDDVQLLEKWVTDGDLEKCPTSASAPQSQTIDLDYIEIHMLDDLNKVAANDRYFTRYLITADLVNEGQTADQLKVAEHAINKALNGLNASLQDVLNVQPVDPAGAIWRFDFRSYGLTTTDIQNIEHADASVNIVSHTTKGILLGALAGTDKPWFHAANFIDVTYRNSALYYSLLRIPFTLEQLLAEVGVDARTQLANQDAALIGSNESKISEHKNRLLIRLSQARSQDAYFWQTDDVNKNNLQANKNLFQFPLIAGTGGRSLFSPDASEVIYSLPNGHQAYALFDGAGKRLNFADPNVVNDTDSPLSTIINNANSCTRCHHGGLNLMLDQVQAAVDGHRSDFNPNDVAIVDRIYKKPENAIFARDNSFYTKALVKSGIDPLAEDPMNVVTDHFLLNWNLDQAAAFLLLSVDDFTAALNTSSAASAQIGQLLTTGGTVTFEQFTQALPQLIKDARLFQDPLGE